MSEIAFTHNGRKNAKAIGTPCMVTPSRDEYPMTPIPTTEEFWMIAVWDTGATSSAITRGVVDFLGLEPIGDKGTFDGANGVYKSDLYMVDIYLSEEIVFRNVVVSEIKHDTRRIAIIGLDIILQSDFGITTDGDKYHIHFRHPSMGNLEFESAPVELSVAHIKQSSDDNKKEAAH